MSLWWGGPPAGHEAQGGGGTVLSTGVHGRSKTVAHTPAECLRADFDLACPALQALLQQRQQ